MVGCLFVLFVFVCSVDLFDVIGCVLVCCLFICVFVFVCLFVCSSVCQFVCLMCECGIIVAIIVVTLLLLLLRCCWWWWWWCCYCCYVVVVVLLFVFVCFVCLFDRLFKKETKQASKPTKKKICKETYQNSNHLCFVFKYISALYKYKTTPPPPPPTTT